MKFGLYNTWNFWSLPTLLPYLPRGNFTFSILQPHWHFHLPQLGLCTYYVLSFEYSSWDGALDRQFHFSILRSLLLKWSYGNLWSKVPHFYSGHYAISIFIIISVLETFIYLLLYFRNWTLRISDPYKDLACLIHQS